MLQHVANYPFQSYKKFNSNIHHIQQRASTWTSVNFIHQTKCKINRELNWAWTSKWILLCTSSQPLRAHITKMHRSTLDAYSNTCWRWGRKSVPYLSTLEGIVQVNLAITNSITTDFQIECKWVVGKMTGKTRVAWELPHTLWGPQDDFQHEFLRKQTILFCLGMELAIPISVEIKFYHVITKANFQRSNGRHSLWWTMTTNQCWHHCRSRCIKPYS